MCVCVCFETVWFRVRFGHEQMKNNIFCFEKKKIATDRPPRL